MKKDLNGQRSRKTEHQRSIEDRSLLPLHYLTLINNLRSERMLILIKTLLTTRQILRISHYYQFLVNGQFPFSAVYVPVNVTLAFFVSQGNLEVRKIHKYKTLLKQPCVSIVLLKSFNNLCEKILSNSLETHFRFKINK